MKTGLPYSVYAVVTIFMCLVFLNGCATHGKTVKNTSAPLIEAEVAPAELKITEFIRVKDTIEITVYRHNDLNKTIQISNSGTITYPFIGDIKASGLGILELRDIIRDGLSKYIVNPQVSVNVNSIQSQKFSVLGEVNSPGIFSLERPVNLIEAIATAGGSTENAKQKSVLLIRGGLRNPQLITIDLDKALKEGEVPEVTYIQKGDIVYVPATSIANASRYFAHISKIIAPFLQLESAYFIGQQIERGQATVSTVPASN